MWYIMIFVFSGETMFKTIIPLLRQQSKNAKIGQFLKNNAVNKDHFYLVASHNFSTTHAQLCSSPEEEVAESTQHQQRDDFVEKFYDPNDRSRYISPDLSIKYMESAAYRATYGDDPVWKHYRRNMKGGQLFIPKTRDSCVLLKRGVHRVDTASPCPICRDEYLQIDYRNVALLEQFMDPYSGVLYSSTKTGLCQYQWRRLKLHIEKAKDYGLLNLDALQYYYDENLYKQ